MLVAPSSEDPGMKRVALWLPVFLGVLACGTPASGPLAAWDQSQVTSLAQQLAAACTDWDAAVVRQPEAGPRLQQNARTLIEQSTTLAAHLAHGANRKQALDYYLSLREVVDDTEELIPRIDLIDPSLLAWRKVANLVHEIAPYFYSSK